MPDIRQILDPLPVDRNIKAEVWDAYHAAGNQDDFKARFDRLNIPREAKAALWDSKFSVPASGPPATSTGVTQTQPQQGLATGIATFEGFYKPGSRAARNLNPGNLRAGPRAVSKDPQGFAVYDSEEKGWQDLQEQITRDAGRQKTLRQFVQGYAPSSDNNDPEAYTQYLAQHIGADPDAPLAALLQGQAAPGPPEAPVAPPPATPQAQIDPAAIAREELGRAGLAARPPAMPRVPVEPVKQGVEEVIADSLAPEEGENWRKNLPPYARIPLGAAMAGGEAVARIPLGVLDAAEAATGVEAIGAPSRIFNRTMELSRERDTFLDPKADPLRSAEGLAATAGQGVGSTLGFTLAGGGIGKAVGALGKVRKLGPVAKSASQIASGVLGASGLETTSESGMTYREAREEGVPKEQAQKAAKETAIRHFPATVATNVVGAAIPVARNPIVRFGIGPVGEAGQEIVQGAATRAGRAAAGLKTSEDPVKESLQEGGAGVVGGLVTGALLGKRGRVRQPAAARTEQAELPPPPPLEQPKPLPSEGMITPRGEVATEQEAEPEPQPAEPRKPSLKLPHHLAGAKPRYSYGPKQFTLDFADDIDKAAYIAAQSTPSKRDEEYVQFVSDALGIDEEEVRNLGQSVRARVKEMARDSEPGALAVDGVIMPRFRGASAAEAPQAKPEAKQAEPEPPQAIEQEQAAAEQPALPSPREEVVQQPSAVAEEEAREPEVQPEPEPKPEPQEQKPAEPPPPPPIEQPAPKPEPEAPKKYKFSSTQINLTGPASQKLIEESAKIPDEDLAEDGRESEPHITVKYGLHGEDPEEVRAIIEQEPPITARLGKTSVFPDSGSGDVVKVDVESDDLRRLNKKISDALPNTNTHPDYKPHVTIAYVKPGLGEKYSGIAALDGQTVTIDRVVFSSKDGSRHEIPLNGIPSPESIEKSAPQAQAEPESDLERQLRESIAAQKSGEKPAPAPTVAPAPARPHRAKPTGPAPFPHAESVQYSTDRQEDGLRVFDAYGTAKSGDTGSVTVRGVRGRDGMFVVERRDAGEDGKPKVTRIGDMYSRQEAKQVAESYLKGQPSPFASAEAGVPIAEYRPSGSAMSADASLPSGVIDGDEVWTDGHGMFRGEPPNATADMVRRDADASGYMTPFWEKATAAATKSVRPIGSFRRHGVQMVAFDDGTVIDAGYYDYAVAQYGEPEFRVRDSQSPVGVFSGGKAVGVVMPAKKTEIPASLKEKPKAMAATAAVAPQPAAPKQEAPAPKAESAPPPPVEAPKAEAKPAEQAAGNVPKLSEYPQTDAGYEQWAKAVHNASLSFYKSKTPFVPDDMSALSDEELRNLKSAVEEAARWHPRVQPSKDQFFTSPEQRESMQFWNKQKEAIKNEEYRRGEPAREAEREHNRQASRAADRAELDRALTVRPANPTPEDVAARSKDSVPDGYKVARAANGVRLLIQTGTNSTVQQFDTRTWQWTDEYTGPPKKAIERFNEYSKKPITQEDLDAETKYIRGHWAQEHGVAAEPEPARKTEPEPPPPIEQPKAKEPWQMTRTEWLRTYPERTREAVRAEAQRKIAALESDIKRAKGGIAADPNNPANGSIREFIADSEEKIREQQKRTEAQIKPAEDVLSAEQIRWHHVEQALRSGKPVPAEVLADYPELQRPQAAEVPAKAPQKRVRKPKAVAPEPAAPEPIEAPKAEAKPKKKRINLGSERGSFSMKPTGKSADPKWKRQEPRLKDEPSFGRALYDEGKRSIDRIREEGDAGRDLARRIDKSRDYGEVRGAQRLNRLREAGIEKATREELWAVHDYMKGISPSASPRVRAIAEAAQKGLQEIDKEKRTRELRKGMEAGKLVRPEGETVDFPRIIPATKKLQEGAVRSDIIENMVEHIGAADNNAEAAALLDAFINFRDTKVISQSLVDYVIGTGQAVNEEAAKAKIEGDKAVWPFYDPNPARALPDALLQRSLESQREEYLGKGYADVHELVGQIRANGGDADYVDYAVKRILGIIDEPDQKVAKVARTLRAFGALRMTTSAIRNIAQGPATTWIAGDFKAMLAGARHFTPEGRKFGHESGAAVEAVVHEVLRQHGAESNAVGNYLRGIGMTKTETWNRLGAAVGGADFVARMHKQLRQNPGDKKARMTLEKFGIDPAAAARKEELSYEELLLAGKKFSDYTQGRSGVQDMPLWSTTQWGRLATQFKSYSYNMGKMLFGEVRDSIKAGDYKNAARVVILAASILPLSEEAYQVLRSWLTGRERDDTPLQRYFEALMGSSLLGPVSDAMKEARKARLAEWAAGAQATAIYRGIEAALNSPKALGKWAYREIPILGSTTYNYVFPRKKAAPQIRRNDNPMQDMQREMRQKLRMTSSSAELVAPPSLG